MDDLKRSEARFRTIVEEAPEAIVLCDLNLGRFVLANNRAVELFGVPLEQLLTLGPVDVFPELQPSGEVSADVCVTHIEAALRGEKPTFEWYYRHADGTQFPADVRLVRLPGDEPLVRASITDIRAEKAAQAERQRLEEELAQSRRMEALGQLTGGVAHDFNNLLTVIRGSAELLRLQADGNHATREFLDEILLATEHAAELTQGLLSFSRKQYLSPRAVDPSRRLARLQRMLRRVLGEKIRIESELSERGWTCRVDPAQLDNAIVNLAVNARDAMPDGGVLRVQSDNHTVETKGENGLEKGQYVRIRVSDTGSGIAPEIVDRVFDPFFTTKDEGKGTGLGLSTVFGFVKQSGGQIQLAESTPRGTTFDLFFPRHTDSAPIVQKAEVEPSLGDGEHVLVVEDDPRVLRLAFRMVTRLGYRVSTAASAATALPYLEADEPPRAMFADLGLPDGMDGVELAHRALEHDPTMGIVIASGYPPDTIRKRLGALPEAIVLQKPYTKQSLARSIRKTLGPEK